LARKLCQETAAAATEFLDLKNSDFSEFTGRAVLALARDAIAAGCNAAKLSGPNRSGRCEGQ